MKMSDLPAWGLVRSGGWPSTSCWMETARQGLGLSQRARSRHGHCVEMVGKKSEVCTALVRDSGWG